MRIETSLRHRKMEAALEIKTAEVMEFEKCSDGELRDASPASITQPVT